MDEIGRAVERVDYPLIFVRALLATFLGQYRVLGIVIVDDLDNGFLGAVIDFGHVFVAILLGDFERLELVELPNHEFACPTGSAHCDIDHTVHVGVLLAEAPWFSGSVRCRRVEYSFILNK